MLERLTLPVRFGGAWVARVAVAVLCLGLAAAGKPPSQAPGGAGGIDIHADVAILVEPSSGAVLFAKNEDKPIAAASLVKMMTVAVAGEEIKAGRLSLDGEFTMSEHAWRTGGAPSHTQSMFAPVNSKVRVSDLFRGLMVQSANDAAIALAEGIAGTEGAFCDLMNRHAAEIGMTASHFGNPTGLPGAENVTTARDLARLAEHLLNDHPDLYKFWSEREFTYNNIRQFNRNPLIAAGIGADGLTTGYLKEAGWSIVGSAEQGRQRLVVVIAGSAAEKDRNEEARKLLDWGFRSYESSRLYEAGEVIGQATVFGGAERSVSIASPVPVDILVPRGGREKLHGRVVYTGPIAAPVSAGSQIGKLVVYNDERTVVEYPVVATESVGPGSTGRRATDGLRELLIGLLRR